MTETKKDDPGLEARKNEAMADLRVFLEEAEAEGELQEVSGAKADEEIGALFEMSNEHLYPPVLLYKDIPGFDPAFRILSNVRTARFLVGDLTLDAVKAYRNKPKEKTQPIPPEFVNSGPVMDNVIEGDDVNVLNFPAPKWHGDDGGNYIGTECLVIIKDPDSDWVNIGTYRVMVQDEKTLSIFIEPGKHGDVIRRKYWAKGEACPICVSVGQAPILGVAAASAARPGQSEYDLAGGRIGRPVRVVAGLETGLPIPADSELVFEGHMPPPEEDARAEGPFGEWPGYYASGDRPEPVVKVKTVYHRNDPLILGQPPVKPNYPGRQIKIPRVATLWDAVEAAGVPGIKGVWQMPGGGSRFINIVSIEQLHAGHAKMAGLVMAGCGPGAYMTRMIIIVDDDIDITNPAEVMWAMATRWDPKTQTDIIDGCYTGHIDPTLSPQKREAGDITNSRIIVYAVRPYHWKDDFPKVNMVSSDYADEVRKKWQGKLRFLDQ
jgi:4-hydroxy-3-polyprenylbenzoate decarboxylase